MDNSIFQKIKDKLDIVDIVSQHVDLTKKGKNFWCLCPFHEDSNPSMSVSPEKQLFKCFVCGAGGDLIKFNSKIKNISFGESLREMANKAEVPIESYQKQEKVYTAQEESLIKVMEDANNFFQYALHTEDGKRALDYAKKRHLSLKILEDFLIGYAPKDGLVSFLKKKNNDMSIIINASLANNSDGDFFRDRLIFGIKNNDGKIVAFSGRSLDQASLAKYINSADTPLFSKSKILYNYANALEFIKEKKTVFINEGFMDVIAMHRAGIRNSIAIMGTALTKEHIYALKRFKVHLMLDGDRAGIAATIKSVKLLLENNVNVTVVKNETKKDPDEILEEYGVEKLIEVTKHQIDGLEYIYNLHIQKYKHLNPTNINLFINSFGKYLANQSALVIEFYKNQLSQYLNLSKENIIFNIKETPTQKPLIANETKATKKRNYSYTLILSLLKNKDWINYFKSERINFSEPVIISIWNYLKKASGGSKASPNKEIVNKVAEITESGKYVTTKEEFLDLIKRVNNETLEWIIEDIDVKLENTRNDDEAAKLLTKKLNLIKKKRV
ncbi:DNA primase [Candidatus Mycoplasma mahonii]|uniref:DNA primase n=1 Tax=Candidatus Mycoplasma mahonii TaxID=3004105 RepID=UPI0026EF2CBE|nr:DNA primase [Candidatus Mycoplasma mahonii]WKX02218.1 DNA primase [Candidatus Mycoplasma mahonii]